MPVPKTLNLIKNPSFAEGKKKPLRWAYVSSNESARVERVGTGKLLSVPVGRTDA